MRAFLVALLAFAALQVAHAAALADGRFVENDGWKARITVDCLLKGKVCGSFRYETLACEGDLVYSGETPTGFEFRTELKAGRCLPACIVQLSNDFKRYAEICNDSRHEGTLSALVSTPGSTTDRPATTPIATAGTTAAAPIKAGASPPAAAAPAPQVAAVTRPAATTAAATAPPARAPAPTPVKLSGQVHYRWDNGDVFDGLMADGKRNGKGRFIWASGQIYDGDWREDIATGEGQMIFVNGDRYTGQVSNGIPEGKGKMLFAKGDTFEGQFTKGTPDVEGVYVEKDGSRYTGQLKDGLKNGRGTFAWSGGQKYEGDWVADRPEGKGVIVFANGDRYEGQVVDGIPQGKGVRLHSGTQDRYEGDFVNGEAQGDGKYAWKNGDVYVGAWVKGQKAGKGRYTWINGDYWEGAFAEDKKTEEGRLYFKSTVTASASEATNLARSAEAAAPTDAGPGQAIKVDDRSLDRARLLAIPMVAKELRECQRKQGVDCQSRVVQDVLNDNLQPNQWQTIATEKGAKGPVFEVALNSVLEGGDVFSWLRSGDANKARNIGIKYACKPQTLEIQLVYHCTGGASCKLDPNIDKYAGKILPANDIRGWFKEACER